MVFCYNECCRRVRRQICSNNGNEKEATTLDMVMQMQLEKDETQHAMNGPAADDAAVLFAELLEEYPYTEPKRGDIRQGTILWVGDDSVLMDVGAKRDAIVQRQDLNRLDESIIAGLEVGAELPVLVLRTAQKDDELIVSIKRGLEDQVWQTAQAAMDDKAVMELTVIGQNKGGLLVDYEGLRGFVPSSHVPALRYLRNDAREERKQELIGTEMPVQVIEVDRRRRRLVMSGRAAARHMRSQRLQELEAGQIVTALRGASRLQVPFQSGPVGCRQSERLQFRGNAITIEVGGLHPGFIQLRIGTVDKLRLHLRIRLPRLRRLLSISGHLFHRRLGELLQRFGCLLCVLSGLLRIL